MRKRHHRHDNDDDDNSRQATKEAMVSPLVAVVFATASCATATHHQQHHHHPDDDAARHNAFALFNSIHSAMRQWGSSVNHNGMSFYLAQAPQDSVFYHGGFSDTRPTSFEWLAFEIEHAANFAGSWEGRPMPDHGKNAAQQPAAANLDDMLLWHRSSRFQALREPTKLSALIDLSGSAQKLLSSHTQEKGHDDGNGTMPGGPPDPGTVFRGYFHTYRATRPLNFLYIDGEGAAKCPMGSMDSQDLIMLGWNSTGDTSRQQMLAEFQRASGLCALSDEWASAEGRKIDGFIRMEAGFEIIYCDFSPAGGLDLASVQASPFRNESHIIESRVTFGGTLRVFEWLRATAARFHGHPTGRLDVDWSSMVSAFSYPVNLSNTDMTRQDLPRLLHTTAEEKNNIRSRLKDVVMTRGGNPANKKQIVDWQGTVDRIVTRYSQRLEFMTSQNLTTNDWLIMLSTLLDSFTNYLDHSPTAEHSAARRCAQHYLPVHSDEWTPEDHAISAALETVSGIICSSLYTTRRLLINNVAEARGESVLEQARNEVRSLARKLKWSTWRECGSCAINEICSIPMFPVGTVDDYFHPTCKNVSQLDVGYFGPFG